MSLAARLQRLEKDARESGGSGQGDLAGDTQVVIPALLRLVAYVEAVIAAHDARETPPERYEDLDRDALWVRRFSFDHGSPFEHPAIMAAIGERPDRVMLGVVATVYEPLLWESAEGRPFAWRDTGDSFEHTAGGIRAKRPAPLTLRTVLHMVPRVPVLLEKWRWQASQCAKAMETRFLRCVPPGEDFGTGYGAYPPLSARR